jgi:hypothetical protein
MRTVLNRYDDHPNPSLIKKGQPEKAMTSAAQKESHSKSKGDDEEEEKPENTDDAKFKHQFEARTDYNGKNTKPKVTYP